MTNEIMEQLETIALELHDAGDHDSGGVLDQIATELAALREERDRLRSLLQELLDGSYLVGLTIEAEIEAALGQEDAT